MPRKSHHRSRSSVDRVLELLADLDENQVQALLQEAESTIAGNVAVSKGIDLFERPGPPPPPPLRPLSRQPSRRKYLTSLSPRKQTELRRRDSKRASSAQEPLMSVVSRPAKASSDTCSSQQQHQQQNQQQQKQQQGPRKTPRSYKRISRPVLPPLQHPSSASTTPDLCDLLAAYFLDSAASRPTPSSAPSNPATPRTIVTSSPFAPVEPAESSPAGLDLLLEPSPTRAAPRLQPAPAPAVAGADFATRQPTRKISGIFEVLNDGH